MLSFDDQKNLIKNLRTRNIMETMRCLMFDKCVDKNKPGQSINPYIIQLHYNG